MNVIGMHRQQQAIAWINVDPSLCDHMASLGHNELRQFFVVRVTWGILNLNILLEIILQ